MRKFGIACLIISASGCAVSVPSSTTDPAKMPVDFVQKASTVTILDTKPDKAEYLGPVQATSCQRSRWEPKPTDELALTLLKAAAEEKGANTVIDLQYVRSSVNLAQKCYENITAKGIAFKTNP